MKMQRIASDARRISPHGAPGAGATEAIPRAAQVGRRVFLQVGVSAAVGVTAACTSGPARETWRFFTPAQAQTVAAICEQLIPADQDPGAREASVVNYIDLQLSKRFKKHRRVYQQGIEAVDAASRAKFARRFVDLNSGQQIDVLNTIEENSPEFFDLIVAHARQGFYGDPRHGGNRNRVSWKMLGLPFPPVRGREHYPG
jgi:gluconate 2-dehydrogenase gamma chain